MSFGPFAWIPSPGPLEGSQMPERSWRGAGPGFSPAFNASTTGRPQPSRRTGPDLSDEAFCPRTSSDAASTATNMNAEATWPFRILEILPGPRFQPYAAEFYSEADRITSEAAH